MALEIVSLSVYKLLCYVRTRNEPSQPKANREPNVCHGQITVGGSKHYIGDGFDEDEVERLGLDGFIDDGNVDDQDD